MKDHRHRVIFIHSLNNYSGSPKVLAGVIRAFSPKDFRLVLFTTKGEGFLSGLPHVQTHGNGYRWTNSKTLTLAYLLYSQLCGFFRILFYSRRNTVFYINSIIPFGPILACKLTGKQMILHVHEDMNTNKSLYKFCRFVVQNCVRETIFVSNFLKESSPVKGKKHVVYNGITLPNVKSKLLPALTNPLLLMVSSLNREKGVWVFVELAKALSQYSFELVLSATEEQVEDFVKEIGIIPNLKVYSLQTNLASFYKRASLLLQLTQTSKLVETYGLTIVEAMAYGVPAIVPNAGGPLEIVKLTGCGRVCNVEKLEEIIVQINDILADESAYADCSKKCIQEVRQFSISRMQNEIYKIVNEKFNS